MTKKEIESLLKENENIELKSSLAVMEEIIESVSAFANTRGGKILVGVDNASRIIGVQIGKGTLETLANRIAQNTDPKIHPHINVEKIDGKEIIIIEVKESLDRLVLSFGRPFKRVGKATVKMSKDEYERLILEKHKERLQFDKQICVEASLNDIDWEFVKAEFIPLYESISGKKITGTHNSLLESLNCLKNERPTNAGILLFGKDPQKFIMNAHIALARYGTDEVDVKRLDYKEFTGNLFHQIDNCSKYIRENISVMSRLRIGRVQREDIPEYGWFSIRELITNAVCHRDYLNTGTKTIIKMFSNRIEFYNPGGLSKGITTKNIAEMQFSRNPIIAKILAKVEYIEEIGEGWNKILKEHKEHPLKPKIPTVQTDDYTFLANIYSTKEKFKKEEKFELEKNLSDREIKIIELIKKQRSIRSGDVQNMFKVSRDTANRYLNELIKQNVISRKGIGKAVYYTLK